MRTMLVAGLAAVMLLGAGCATRGSVDALEARVSALEATTEAHGKRLDDLEARVTASMDRADESVRRSEAAEAAARQAADRADEAARTADAIFRKSVSK